MNKLDEIALRVADRVYGPTEVDEVNQIRIDFARALLAELSKDAKPVGHTAMSGHGRVFSSSITPPPIQPELWKPVFTHPAPANTAEIDEATAYAKQLATHILTEHYNDVSPEWAVCDSLSGVLTQIDNMIAGLRKAEIEQRVAEACAKVVRNTMFKIGQTSPYRKMFAETLEEIRSGKWREYL